MFNHPPAAGGTIDKQLDMELEHDASANAMEIVPPPPAAAASVKAPPSLLPSAVELSALFNSLTTSLYECAAQDKSKAHEFVACAEKCAHVCASAALPSVHASAAQLHLLLVGIGGSADSVAVKAPSRLIQAILQANDLFDAATQTEAHGRALTPLINALADVCANDLAAAQLAYHKNRALKDSSKLSALRVVVAALQGGSESSDVIVARQTAAARAIWAMSSSNLRIRFEFQRENAVDALVALLASTAHVNLQTQACGALWSLCDHAARTPLYSRRATEVQRLQGQVTAAEIVSVNSIIREKVFKSTSNPDSSVGGVFKTLHDSFLDLDLPIPEPMRFVAVGLIGALCAPTSADLTPVPSLDAAIYEALQKTKCSISILQLMQTGGSPSKHAEGKCISVELEALCYFAVSAICSNNPQFKLEIVKKTDILRWISHVIGGVDHAPLRTEACALVANLCRCNIEHQNKAQMSGVDMSAALAFALQCPDLDTKYAALTALSSLLSASETDWNKFETDFYNPLQKRIAIESTPDLLWFLTSEFEELWLPVSRLIGELAYRNSAAQSILLWTEPRERAGHAKYPKHLEIKYRDVMSHGMLPRGALLVNSFITIAVSMHRKHCEHEELRHSAERLVKEMTVLSTIGSADTAARTKFEALEIELGRCKNALAERDHQAERAMQTQLFALEAIVCLLYKSPMLQSLLSQDESLSKAVVEMFASPVTRSRIGTRIGAIVAVLSQHVKFFLPDQFLADAKMCQRMIELGEAADSYLSTTRVDLHHQHQTAKRSSAPPPAVALPTTTTMPPQQQPQKLHPAVPVAAPAPTAPTIVQRAAATAPRARDTQRELNEFIHAKLAELQKAGLPHDQLASTLKQAAVEFQLKLNQELIAQQQQQQQQQMQQ